MRSVTVVFASLALAVQARQVEPSGQSMDAAIFKPRSRSLETFSSLLLAVNPAVAKGVRSRTAIPRTALNSPRNVEVSMAATPELYVYDHCPFCVRVRLAMGILGKKHKLVFLENDDVETPTALVGKKISPIWVDEDGPMPESLDIIAKVDTEKRIAPASGRTDLKAWQKSVQTLMRKLQRPRYVMVPLPEFMKKGGRDAFVANHQMPPYEKSDWKGNPDFPLEQKYEKYQEAFAETEKLLPEANAKLLELEAMIHSAEACTEGIGLSLDDIDLWARLRSLTIIKGIQIPPKVRAYLDHFEKLGDVPLYDVMAV